MILIIISIISMFFVFLIVEYIVSKDIEKHLNEINTIVEEVIENENFLDIEILLEKIKKELNEQKYIVNDLELSNEEDRLIINYNYKLMYKISHSKIVCKIEEKNND